MNQPSFIPMWMESFRCIAIAHSSKKPQIIKISAIEWEQWQRNTKCWGIRPFTQSSFFQWKLKHTHVDSQAHTHMWMQNWEEWGSDRKRERAKGEARARSNAKTREKVLKSVFWVEFFVQNFHFGFYFPPYIHPTSKHKSWLTLFARSWKLRQQHQQKQNEIVLIENGKIYKKKTLEKCIEMYASLFCFV